MPKQLVIKRDQPFFGAEITAFPLLGREFTDFFTDQINVTLATDNQFDKTAMWEAFQLMGHRPEVLRQLVGQVALNREATSLSELLKQPQFGVFKSKFLMGLDSTDANKRDATVRERAHSDDFVQILMFI